MTLAKSALGVAGFLALAAASGAQASPARLPMDSMTEVHGVNAVCTGAGQADRTRAQWQKYPVKFEFAGGYGQYLGDETLTVTGDKGREVVNVQCEGPWVLMDLSPGHYRAHADVLGASPKEASFTVPANGKRQIVFRFPGKMAGEENKHGA